jgi:hypothetical protein
MVFFGAIALIAVACGDDGAGASDDVVSPAVDVCSRVGSTGDVTPCEDAVASARAQCTALSTADKANCDASLDALVTAAREAAHLVHGECDQLTSDAARSACNLARAITPTPTAAPPGTAAAPATATASPAAPQASSIPAFARALVACGISRATAGNGDDDECADALAEAEEVCDSLARPSQEACRAMLDSFDERAQPSNSESGASSPNAGAASQQNGLQDANAAKDKTDKGKTEDNGRGNGHGKDGG